MRNGKITTLDTVGEMFFFKAHQGCQVGLFEARDKFFLPSLNGWPRNFENLLCSCLEVVKLLVS